MSMYERAKERARKEAINHKIAFSEPGVILTFWERSYWKKYFHDLGKKYGLVTEFREMGLL